MDCIIRYFREAFLIKPGKKMSPLLLYGTVTGTVENQILVTFNTGEGIGFLEN
ncbi:MAG: hypothetical protein PVSMB11_07280 [Desulfuromonadaceae bacterium]